MSTSATRWATPLPPSLTLSPSPSPIPSSSPSPPRGPSPHSSCRTPHAMAILTMALLTTAILTMAVPNPNPYPYQGGRQERAASGQAHT
eukprot:scaffold129940_cov45-Phaeocystis_antarctica.AAC.2